MFPGPAPKRNMEHLYTKWHINTSHTHIVYRTIRRRTAIVLLCNKTQFQSRGHLDVFITDTLPSEMNYIASISMLYPPLYSNNITFICFILWFSRFVSRSPSLAEHIMHDTRYMYVHSWYAHHTRTLYVYFRLNVELHNNLLSHMVIFYATKCSR